MDFISGGYYIIAPTIRQEYMDKEIIPDRIVSVSECICNMHPDIDIFWGGSKENKLKYIKDLNISVDKYKEMEKWIQDKFDLREFQYPQIFPSLNLAKEFFSTFLNDVKDLRIIGIGLPNNYLESFFDEEDTINKSTDERTGIENVLIRKEFIVDETNLIKGYEVLGYETNTFHSYLCNGLEKEFKNKFDFSLNENGFIKSLAEAERCCDIANDENLGTEPFFWLPWAIFEYNSY
ncbi:hypothetical protein ACFWM3_18675 [Gottfriedia sp. NPDC058432]|uniref:hypothetical protein n=1 Tax=Gottfriedia sp. NPDC058432 TaxID=3346497 RepID=UPI0036508C4E